MIAVIAITLFAVVEVMVAYQKYQIKRQFLDEMDKKDSENSQ